MPNGSESVRAKPTRLPRRFAASPESRERGRSKKNGHSRSMRAGWPCKLAVAVFFYIAISSDFAKAAGSLSSRRLPIFAHGARQTNQTRAVRLEPRSTCPYATPRPDEIHHIDRDGVPWAPKHARSRRRAAVLFARHTQKCARRCCSTTRHYTRFVARWKAEL